MHLRLEIELPFYLRLEESLTLPYSRLCSKPRLASLETEDVTLSFDVVTRRIDNSAMLAPRSLVIVEATPRKSISEEEVGLFFLRDGLRILNRLVATYQAETEEVSNAGYIEPLGRADIQLYAKFLVDGRNIRDRWPAHSVNTFSLGLPTTDRIRSRMLGLRLAPDSLFSANARVVLARGQYSLAVVQAAVAAELRITRYVVRQLRRQGRPKTYVERYRRLSLGNKVRFKAPDPRSLEVYCAKQPRFKALLRMLRTSFVPLRNRVVHEGHLATPEEASRCLRQKGAVFKMLSSQTDDT